MHHTPASSATQRPPLRLPFFYGWVILGVSMLGLFISGPGQTYVVSVFIDPIIAETGWSRTMVSGLYSAGSLSAAPIMVLVGRLLDRYGARTMLTVVGVLFGFAGLWMGRVEQPFHLYLGFLLIRTLGQGSLTLIPTTLVAQWFVRRRGRAIAISSLGSVVSQAVFPPLVYLLIAGLGWRSAWAVLAAMIWLVLPPLAVLLVRHTPESVGLLPDGDGAKDGPGQGITKSTPQAAWDWSLGEALRSHAFWLLLVASSSQSLVSTALVFHHVSLMETRGLGAGVAATVLMVIAPLSLVGTFAAGFLSDRFSGRHLLALGQALLALAMLWTFVIGQPWQALAYGAILGLGGGFTMTLFNVVWPTYFGRRHLGSIRGVVTTGMVAFAALGPLPFGWLFDLTGGYSAAVLIFLALPAASAVAALLAGPPHAPRTALPIV